MPRLVARAATLAAALLVALSTSATAQLELPKSRPAGSGQGEAQGGSNEAKARTKPKVPGRSMVPHLVCSVCGEHNYLAKMDQPTPDGYYAAYCSVCKLVQKHKRDKDVAQDERIDLPHDGGHAVLPGAEGAPGGGDAQAGAQPGAQGGDGSRYGDGPAAFILQQVAEVDDVGDPLVGKAIESLLGLGEAGRVAARVAIHDKLEPVVVAAGRVLVRGGQAEDAERLQQMLRGKLPGRSGTLLLDELVQRDPVHGSPAFLCELLDHRQQPLRQAAERLLAPRMSPELLPELAAPLASERTDTRLMAIDLAVRVDDPALVDLLLDHLADRSARVASQVATYLAQSSDARVDLELLARAFQSRWILRENAYALLALVEREDLSLRPILDERHVEPLLLGLESSDPLTVGACAAALAGIGYRSAYPDRTTWLDRDVTGFMVAAISGKTFHNDFSALQPRVLRRLRLLTGEDFGTDGPKWTAWWVEHRATFYAHRAYLGVPEGGEGKLELYLQGTGAGASLVSLIGADVDEREAQRRAAGSELIYLTERECKDLLSLLEREWVLGPQRPPGLRGKAGIGMRALEVRIAGQGKTFSFGPNATEPWFERLCAAVRDVADRNRWQRYPDNVRYASAREFWETEAGWWGGDHDEHARAERMKGLVLGTLPAATPSQRTGGLRELVHLYRDEGLASAEDFPLLLDLLRDEGFYTGRAELLVELCLASARAGAPDGHADVGRCDELAQLLLARFQTDALDALRLVARSAGRDYVRRLIDSPEPLLRAVAAGELAESFEPADAPLLMALLEDVEPRVEAAACLALGQAKAEAARTELLLRARLADPYVRAAALRAIGALGGDYVLEALVLGVSDPDPEVTLGAARGLVALADPQSAPLFISLLRRGRDSEVYPIAREGLLRLGEAAKADLLRVVNSPAHQARRDVALLLSGMLVPEVVPALIDMVDDAPEDPTLGFELAVLSCIDVRSAPDPAARWAEWYDDVTHGSALPWLLAAAERRGVSAPAPREFDGEGTREARRFLFDLLGRDEDFLVERARRELGRLVGKDLGELPRDPVERDAWLATLHEALLTRTPEGGQR
ncbi:MAG: HEAT repeat domain-containing protein [Planctomycetes bacterium]|nr:HEAT repeat domain-containing protein [Planctomycetota bacterium]